MPGPNRSYNLQWGSARVDELDFDCMGRLGHIPCELGNYAAYSIRVTGADDVVAGLRFAQEKNIRLSIRNTGHDYNGKSSGLGSLSLWTHHLNTKQIIPRYHSAGYSGPAIKLGAGVVAGEALEFASQNGYQVVTGECGTVGISGGYTQGGGHGPLNGAYGLAADNVLEWEVVTGEGKHVVATPEKNADIYWALSGGGGGTYGVVLSMTAKVHPDGPVTGPILAFHSPAVGNETFWKAIGIFYKHLPDILRGTNNSAQFNTWNNDFSALFVFLDQSPAAVNTTLGPLLAELDSIRMPYTLTVGQTTNFRDYYNSIYGPLPYGLSPPSTSLNSRLIPEWVVVDPNANKKLLDAVRLTTNTGEFHVACTAADLNKTDHSDNAVLPAWRQSIFACNMVVFWNWTAPLSDNLERKNRMVSQYAPAMDAATPGSGVYLNEIDPWYKGDFKQTMYGSNYPRLLNIKHKHDPHHLFYGFHAVGSDEFHIDGSGRLCYGGT
ncbi:hypothetical protein DL768_010721 [Monosporascus sp. mg162]|nr:hypothetical protein DL768_010721 [Monosporascus sp. mg162]